MRLCKTVNGFWLVAGAGSVTLICGLFVVNNYSSNFNTGRSIGPAIGDRNSKTKRILFWNTMFGNEDFWFGKGDKFKHCPGLSDRCWSTTHETLVDVESFDALVIHGNGIDSVNDLPTVRRESQRYVFVNLESPENWPIRLDKIDYDFFNVTMTYRLDSDVVWPYGVIRNIHDGSIVAPKFDPPWKAHLNEATDSRNAEKSNRRSMNETSLIGTKTKTAIWFVSNCQALSKRENYVRELRSHMDVDVFGACGDDVGCPKERKDCSREIVEPNYHFYLSFENSMCTDYVTEKLYTALQYNVVPVVYGGANYSNFAPPKSYINALDFDSPKELAEFLKALIRRPQEYEKYFEWKQHYESVDACPLVICELCRYLNDNNSPKSYSHLNAWYGIDKCPLQEKLLNLPYLTKRNL